MLFALIATVILGICFLVTEMVVYFLFLQSKVSSKSSTFIVYDTTRNASWGCRLSPYVIAILTKSYTSQTLISIELAHSTILKRRRIFFTAKNLLSPSSNTCTNFFTCKHFEKRSKSLITIRFSNFYGEIRTIIIAPVCGCDISSLAPEKIHETLKRNAKCKDLFKNDLSDIDRLWNEKKSDMDDIMSLMEKDISSFNSLCIYGESSDNSRSDGERSNVDHRISFEVVCDILGDIDNDAILKIGTDIKRNNNSSIGNDLNFNQSVFNDIPGLNLTDSTVDGIYPGMNYISEYDRLGDDIDLEYSDGALTIHVYGIKTTPIIATSSTPSDVLLKPTSKTNTLIPFERSEDGDFNRWNLTIKMMALTLFHPSNTHSTNHNSKNSHNQSQASVLENKQTSYHLYSGPSKTSFFNVKEISGGGGVGKDDHEFYESFSTAYINYNNTHPISKKQSNSNIEVKKPTTHITTGSLGHTETSSPSSNTTPETPSPLASTSKNNSLSPDHLHGEDNDSVIGNSVDDDKIKDVSNQDDIKDISKSSNKEGTSLCSLIVTIICSPFKFTYTLIVFIVLFCVSSFQIARSIYIFLVAFFTFDTSLITEETDVLNPAEDAEIEKEIKRLISLNIPTSLKNNSNKSSSKKPKPVKNTRNSKTSKSPPSKKGLLEYLETNPARENFTPEQQSEYMRFIECIQDPDYLKMPERALSTKHFFILCALYYVVTVPIVGTWICYQIVLPLLVFILIYYFFYWLKINRLQRRRLMVKSIQNDSLEVIMNSINNLEKFNANGGLSGVSNVTSE